MLSHAPSGTVLRVFVLAGQSNMVGTGVVGERNETTGQEKNGTLLHQTYDLRTADLFAPVWDRYQWKTLDNMNIWFNGVGYQFKKDAEGHLLSHRPSVIPGKAGVDASYGPLTIGYGGGGPVSRMGVIGPELGFGFGLQEALVSGEKVLIVKNAWASTFLSDHFRPPSSCRGQHGQLSIRQAMRCNSTFSGPNTPVAGPLFTTLVSNVERLLDDSTLRSMFPEFMKGVRHIQLSGFGWLHGWQDGLDAESTAEYEDNLVHLIQDLRVAWQSPDLPVCITVPAFPTVQQPGGARSCFGSMAASGLCKRKCQLHHKQCRRMEVVMSQHAVANTTRHPELQHVVSMETWSFWREPKDSPAPTEYHHYSGNAETFYLIGRAMAFGMLHAMNRSASMRLSSVFKRRSVRSGGLRPLSPFNPRLSLLHES